ncbi:Uncharacterized protein BM_BM17307 [Brugia malayi]|uniref:Uncharacterized protein n=1 Tax=Brugia malayi TaxID=6279 RepID=A0A4E9F1E8_BRUMA|nr:Uncharacterized protein BM_BM17307 [Brugia malayi]VIO90010.1 Uncharacterized protein BM_BM17307 [Brugia malayi]
MVANIVYLYQPLIPSARKRKCRRCSRGGCFSLLVAIVLSARTTSPRVAALTNLAHFVRQMDLRWYCEGKEG